MTHTCNFVSTRTFGKIAVCVPLSVQLMQLQLSFVQIPCTPKLMRSEQLVLTMLAMCQDLAGGEPQTTVS